MAHSFRTFVLALGLILVLPWTGPGAFQAPPPPTAYFFAPRLTDFGHPSSHVMRYRIVQGGATTLETTFSDPSFDAPWALAFNPSGELFVANRAWQFNTPSITRFLNPLGTPIANGTITDPGFARPHGVAFRNNELFVVNSFSNDNRRFAFDPFGNAVPNGVMTDTGGTQRGVAVAPWGELFVSQCAPDNRVDRYTFDLAGNVSSNGSFGVPNNPHGLSFSPWGELFVAAADMNSVYRFLFDGSLNAVANGSIATPPGQNPIDAKFSPWGELFAASWQVQGGPGGSGVIHRYTFNASYAASPNGSIVTSGPLGLCEFAPPPSVSRLKSSVTALVSASQLAAAQGNVLKQLMDSAALRARQANYPAAASLVRSFNSYVTKYVAAGALSSANGSPLLVHSASVADALTNVPAGLAAYWKMDEGAGATTADSSGNGHAGSLVNGPAWVTGSAGKALQFNGSNQFVSAPSMSWPAGGPVTVAFWSFVPTPLARTAFTVGNSNTQRFIAHAPWSDNNIYWDYGTDGSTPSAGRILTSYAGYTNKWTHVTLVSTGQGGNFKAIYLDGVLRKSEPVSNGPNIPLSGAFLAHWPLAGHFHQGSLDDFRIYPRVLSAAEIAALAGNP